MFSPTQLTSQGIKSFVLTSLIGVASCTSTASHKAEAPSASPSNAEKSKAEQGGEEQISKEGISIKAFGNEPFWAVEATQVDLSYSSPEELFSTDYTIVRKGDDIVLTSAESQLRLTIIDQPCADTMADMSYPLTAVLVLRGETKRGCAITPIPK